MLIYFIHGVATKDADYAKNLIKLINEKCKYQTQEPPHCYAGFWGNVLKGTDKLWRDIDQELDNQKQQDSQFNPEQAFRYQNFRKEYFSYFIGDTFSYLSFDTGIKIRKIIANQLRDFVNHHPEEKELHIVAHSLGSVILWDILFCDRFPPSDPVHTIRSLIGKKYGKISLSGVTTMGSPIPFLNLTLDVDEKQIQDFLEEYQDRAFTWNNIINSYDIIAYPIGSLFKKLGNSSKITVNDHYIKMNNDILASVELASVVLNSVKAHSYYLESNEVAKIIVDSVTKNKPKTLTQEAINRLQDIPGMTDDNNLDKPMGCKISLSAEFKDFSGKISLVSDLFGVDHIYIFNNNHQTIYSGYVGWIHGENFKKEVKIIADELCRSLSQEDCFQQSVKVTT
ncbi:lipase family protein [Crocosphaera chwakensis]|uniref:DDHD domain-containing protein n=1 Tax=Crocosphaera chwakensis CCY0110 TaxID=391612 RepID=A3ISD0_9CHRO|nr:hypothetical protein [Crocosphaera chwakensis]EAZ90646.1 hypothetical protein CY0110_08226 [Crocosphaera chwakensis CCY0110]